MSGAYDFLGMLDMILHSFNSVTSFFFRPVGDWLPERIAEIPYGDVLAALVQAFLNSSGFGDYSLIALMFGSGLVLFVVYTLVIWVLDVVN